MRKLITLILSLIMVFSVCLPTYAADQDSNVYAYADEPQLFATIEIPWENPDGNSTRELEVIVVKCYLQGYSNGKYTWSADIDCPTAWIEKPNIDVSLQVKGNFTNGSGSYSNVGSPKNVTLSTIRDYSTIYTWQTDSRTGYYYIQYTIDDNLSTNTKTDRTTKQLANRTGHLWDFNYNAIIKELGEPRADWPKGQVYQRDPNCRANYFAYYTQQTGITLDQSLYDVHHIRPLAYGGDNSMSNLIHLPRDLHQQVTNWFSGY